jgi:large subunit ribosomal protein L10
VGEPRPEKVAVVEEVRARFAGSSAAILTEYRGLKVQEMATLRRALTAAGGEYKVYKNTLVRRAAHESGLTVLEPLLEGPTAIAFVTDDVSAVAKVLRDFARTSPSLIVKGGLVGASFFDAKSAAALADLPSRQTLLAQLAGAIAAPMQKMASLMKAVPQSFAYGLSALIEQRRAAEPAPSPSPVEDSAAAVEESAAPADETADSADAPAVDAGPGAGADAGADAAADAAADDDTAAPADEAGNDTAAPADEAGE